MTPADFRLAFPAFAAETDPVVQRHLDAADPFFDVERWGGFYNDGLGNFVAHRIVTEKADAATGSGPTSGGGDFQSKTLGSFSITKSAEVASMFVDDPLTRTSYGQRYAYLRGLVGIGAIAV
jgi:uncharacterized protein DUF4054